MKKQGFTLAETLITLGIIGIAAALISPSLKNLVPKRDKMEFMECYKQLTSSILPSLNYSPVGDYIYDSVRKKVLPPCVGIACAVDNFDIDSVAKDYNWELNSDTIENLSEESIYYNRTPNGKQPKVYEYAIATCSTPRNKSFSFIIGNNGTLVRIESIEGQNYMKDQFNYYKDGSEDDE